MKLDKLKSNVTRAFCARGSIGIAFDKGFEHVWEELHYCLPAQLDELADKLSGKVGASQTKVKALERLRPLMQEAFGLKDAPELIRRVLGDDPEKREQKKLRRAATRAEVDEVEEAAVQSQSQPEEGDEVMQTATAKKSTGFGAVKSKAEKSSKEKKPAKVVAKIVKSSHGGFKDTSKITVLVKENPRREGTHGHKVFELYKKHKTVGAVLEHGAKVADLKWDVDHKFIKIG